MDTHTCAHTQTRIFMYLKGREVDLVTSLGGEGNI